MFNMIIAFEKCNLNPLADSLESTDRNFFVTDVTSEKTFTDHFLKLCREKINKPADIRFSATRYSESEIFRIHDIRYIESFGNLKSINGCSGTFEFYGTMYKIENAVKRFGFIRVSNSYIISIEHIKRARARNVTMDDGKVINVGRKYIRDYRECLRKMSLVEL